MVNGHYASCRPDIYSMNNREGNMGVVVFYSSSTSSIPDRTHSVCRS